MNILLVNPNQIKPPVVPIALDYLGVAGQNQGHKIKLLDLGLSNIYQHEIDRLATTYSPDLVCVTIRNLDDCYFVSRDCFLPKFKRIVNHLKKKFGKPVVVGGTGFSIMPAQVMSYLKTDFGVIGDGELSLLKLAKYLFQPEKYNLIPGLIYWRANQLVINPVKYFDLNRYPLYRRNIINNYRYLTTGGMNAIETKRGCSQKCVYCVDPLVKGTTYRLKSPQNVVKEIKSLVSQKVEWLHLADSEFNLPYQHSVAVCQEIIKSKLGNKIRWYTYACPKPFTKELARLMRQAGCIGINFGVDSGDDRLLKVLGRNFDADDLISVGKICRDTKLVFMYDLLLGAPTETKITVKRTLDLMRKISPDRVGTAFGIRIYPGTTIADWVLANKINSEDVTGNMFDCLSPAFYFPSRLGDDFVEFLRTEIGNDSRFFIPADQTETKNYNYNANRVLVNAIRDGHRGAFWDILRNLSLPNPKS